jgi:hypothetical protein
MSVIMKAGVIAISALTAGLFLAVPAGAEPGDNPCDHAFNPFCRFVPIAPDLEGDVDLTKLLPPVDPAAPPPSEFIISDPCSAGCI